MADERVKLLNFKDTVQGETLEIGIGMYARKFERAEQPFRITDPEEANTLLRTGHFVDITPKLVEETAPVDSEQQAEEERRRAEEAERMRLSALNSGQSLNDQQ